MVGPSSDNWCKTLLKILRFSGKLKMMRTPPATKALLGRGIKGEGLAKKRSILTRDFKHTSMFERQLKKKSQRKRVASSTSVIPTL